MLWAEIHVIINIGHKDSGGTHMIHGVPLARDLHVDVWKMSRSSFVISFLWIEKKGNQAKKQL